MSVTTFLENFGFPSSTVIRRAVTLTACATAALSASSSATTVTAPAHVASDPGPAAVPAAWPGTDPSLPMTPATPGSTGVMTPAQLTASGIPALAYQAYVAAAASLAASDPTCQVHWSLIAALARVESDHGRFGGSAIGADGIVIPPILGVVLDGSTPGTARIGDSDDGRYDGDPQMDRAVGPLQFLPATWETYGSGTNPQNINAAALAAGRYLCTGDTTLTTQAAKWTAVYRYNHSDSYVSLVLSVADTYATGTPGSALPVGTAPLPPPVTVPVAPPAGAVPGNPITIQPTKTPAERPKPRNTRKPRPGHPRPPKHTPTKPPQPRPTQPAPTQPAPAPTTSSPTTIPLTTPIQPPPNPTTAPPTLVETPTEPTAPTTTAPWIPPTPHSPTTPPAGNPTPAPPPTPTNPFPPPTIPAPPTGPHRSGLPWASGVFIPGNNPAQVEAFGTWRGRPVDLTVTWSPRQTWNDVVSPTAMYQTWASTPYTKVFGVPPIPVNEGATLARCAAGDYDVRWSQFATTIAAAGIANTSIIRLGWEFNGGWYAWKATDPAAFAACWRRIYITAESIAPALRWDWSVNRGPSQALPDPAAAYPGDAYVDYIGVDSYDVWPGATSEAAWQHQYAGPHGLKYWADFAAIHGKQLSVPEWGVYPGTGQAGRNGGDNPFYIAKMHEFFRNLGPRLAYEAYFNENAAYYAGSLHNPQQAPAAATQYLRGLVP